MTNLLLLPEDDINFLRDIGFDSEWKVLLAKDDTFRQCVYEKMVEIIRADSDIENPEVFLTAIISYMERNCLESARNKSLDVVKKHKLNDLKKQEKPIISFLAEKLYKDYVEDCEEGEPEIWSSQKKKQNAETNLHKEVRKMAKSLFQELSCSDNSDMQSLYQEYCSYLMSKKDEEYAIDRAYFIHHPISDDEYESFTDNLFVEQWLSYAEKINDSFMVSFIAYWIAFEHLLKQEFSESNSMRARIKLFAGKYRNRDNPFQDIVKKVEPFELEELTILANKSIETDKYSGKDPEDDWIALKKLISKCGYTEYERTEAVNALFQTIYSIRCNLVHGEKKPKRERDINLIKASTVVLKLYLDTMTKRDGQ